MAKDELKRAAAVKAVALVRPGMTVGLGTGSTAAFALEELARRLSAGELHGVAGVPTSTVTAEQAERLKVPLVPLGAEPLDIAIDGMDEIDDRLDAIKGLGGALTREKIVAVRARQVVLIGDDSKRVKRLGERAPVPVEVVPFAAEALKRELAAFGCLPQLRRNSKGEHFITDNGNLILDCFFETRFEPGELAASIKALVGVVEHGLFVGIAQQVFLADATDTYELRR